METGQQNRLDATADTLTVKLQQSLYCLYFKCHKIKILRVLKIFRVLKTSSLIVLFAAILWKFYSLAKKIFLYSYAAIFRCFTGLASMMQRYEIFVIYASFLAIIFQKNAESEVTHLPSYPLLTSAFLKSRETILYNLYIL